MIKYLITIALISLSVIACTTDDSKSPVMQRQALQNQFFMYVGDSIDGGTRILVMDSLLNSTLSSYFNAQYSTARNKYLYTSILFYGDRITYINESSNKYISTYAVHNDSLFTYDTNNTPIFIARTFSPDTYKDSVYLAESYFKYSQKQSDSTTYKLSAAQNSNDYMTLEQALKKASFQSLADMKHRSDTIMWWNIKYTFK